jgi:hypothetical protein
MFFFVKFECIKVPSLVLFFGHSLFISSSPPPPQDAHVGRHMAPNTPPQNAMQQKQLCDK